MLFFPKEEITVVGDWAMGGKKAFDLKRPRLCELNCSI